jgi:PAS domain S-box-containing protein
MKREPKTDGPGWVAMNQLPVWRSTFNAISDVVCVVGPNHEIVEINDAGCRVTGLEREQIIGRMCFEVLLGADAPLPGCPCRQVEQTRKPASYAHRAGAGVFEMTAWPILGNDGNFEGVVHVARDVTDHHVAEEALRESERRLATLLDNLPGMAYRCRNDPQWTMEFVSRASQSLTGYAPEELVGNARASYAALIHPEDADFVRREVQRAVDAGIPFALEYRIRDASGREKQVQEKGRAVVSESGAVAIEGFIADVTEQRRVQKQLEMAQRLEAVGQLAGGIAHDFNNLLLVINTTAELAMDEVPASDPIRADLGEIRQAGQRAATLTRQLLAFSRRQVLAPKLIGLNDVVRGVEGMLRRLLNESIRVELRLASSLGLVRADPGQVEQIVINLAVNARDAMPGGGALWVETADVMDSSAHEGLEPGNAYVRLSVEDSGVGMSSEIARHVFEPFFTTKELGKGGGRGGDRVGGGGRRGGEAVDGAHPSGRWLSRLVRREWGRRAPGVRETGGEDRPSHHGCGHAAHEREAAGGSDA